jgi:hypothetical protein
MRICTRRSGIVKPKWPYEGRLRASPADDDQLNHNAGGRGPLDIQLGRKAAVVAGDHADDFEAAPQAVNVGSSDRRTFFFAAGEAGYSREYPLGVVRGTRVQV